MRFRYFGFVLLATLLMSTGVMSSVNAAQDESGSAFGDIDLPTISIELSGGALDLPAELEAGRYIVDVDNQLEASTNVMIVGLPDGLSFEQAMEDAEAAGGEAPDWFFEASTPGGVVTPPGESGKAVVNLIPGEYAVVISVWEGEGDPGMPQLLMITGDAAALDSMPEPNADVDAELLDFEFVFSDPIASGSGVWAITNSGEQPHEISLVRGPDGITVDEVLMMTEADMMGTPVPDDFPYAEEDFLPVGNTSTISAGQTTWVPFDLEPGTYIAFCFIPDPDTGLPHMMLGMTEVFTVE